MREPSRYSIRVVCAGPGPADALVSCLEAEGVAFSVAEDDEAPGLLGVPPDAVVLDLTQANRRVAEALAQRTESNAAPAIAAISAEHLRVLEPPLASDEVIVVPWPPGELSLRIARLVEKRIPADAPGIVRAGDLVIDTNRYDVFLAGRAVLLTFKEYELLKLLASNPGRVYSRDALLEQVWGYHYFGGTRTVDVHIRRLRSKVEDATHTFIDTVWNVGYRFHG